MEVVFVSAVGKYYRVTARGGAPGWSPVSPLASPGLGSLFLNALHAVMLL
jgi:hypothetical protein